MEGMCVRVAAASACDSTIRCWHRRCGSIEAFSYLRLGRFDVAATLENDSLRNGAGRFTGWRWRCLANGRISASWRWTSTYSTSRCGNDSPRYGRPRSTRIRSGIPPWPHICRASRSAKCSSASGDDCKASKVIE